jgi:riboflavin-specific deaminase-like protein
MTSAFRVAPFGSKAAARLAVRANRPFVFMNMAMTADGKIATENRRVSSFGSQRDQEHLYELRATADGVMVGARTIDLNDIKLGPGGARFRKQRVEHGLAEYNLRVIVSGSGTVRPDAVIFKHRFSPILLLTCDRVSSAKLKRLRALADDVLVCGETQVDFAVALRWLRQKWKVQRLLVEGGGELNSALFEGGFVDELHLTICPKIFGGRHAPTIADGRGAAYLSDAAALELKSFDRTGDELFVVYRVSQKGAPRPNPTNRSAPLSRRVGESASRRAGNETGYRRIDESTNR